MKRLLNHTEWAWPLMIPVMALLAWVFLIGIITFAGWIVDLFFRE